MFRRSPSRNREARWGSSDAGMERSNENSRYLRTKFDCESNFQRSRHRSRSPLHRDRSWRRRRVTEPSPERGRYHSSDDEDSESSRSYAADDYLDEFEHSNLRTQQPGTSTQTQSLGDVMPSATVTRTQSSGNGASERKAPDMADSPDFAGFSMPGTDEVSRNFDSGIDPGLLKALGENPLVPPPPAPALHESVADRWKHHLLHGLPADVFTSIKETYPVPANLQLLSPPKLNPEIVASVGSTQKSVDAQYVSLQKQCSTAIAALGMGLTKIIEQGGEATAIMQPSYQNLCDAGRAMTALFFDISRTRRRIIQNCCTNTLTTISRDVPPSEWLFGDELGSRFRARLGLESSCKGLVSLKKPPPNPPKKPQPQRQVSLQTRGSGNGRGRAARGGQTHSKAKPQAFQPQYQDQGSSQWNNPHPFRTNQGGSRRQTRGYRQ
ncbi:hypothetical protein GE061_018969 [Apolygus lucorum]|uniref:Uncharacterized protein n=1 Tax=Apolygus lucorum TaxID=248454 RepID=A0A8S9X749_APOLU|nr:hypothetical protein GE061_018969 [Apolygus lucorum]